MNTIPKPPAGVSLRETLAALPGVIRTFTDAGETLEVHEDHPVMADINRLLTWLEEEQRAGRHVSPAIYRAQLIEADGWTLWAARILELDGRVVKTDTYDGRRVIVRPLTSFALGKADTKPEWAYNLLRAVRRRVRRRPQSN